MDHAAIANPPEVWLYGSVARGDADRFSDVDLLVVADQVNPMEQVAEDVGYPVGSSISVYSWKEVEAMASYGSIFLHHIGTEGRCLRASTHHPKRFLYLLSTLPPYQSAGRDMRSFQATFRDVLSSLTDGGWPDFEFQILGAMVRHAAILGAYCAGSPSYGRETPFQVSGDALGYGRERWTLLARGATAYRQGRLTAAPDYDQWLNQVGTFLEDLGDLVDDYDRALHQAA